MVLTATAIVSTTRAAQPRIRVKNPQVQNVTKLRKAFAVHPKCPRLSRHFATVAQGSGASGVSFQENISKRLALIFDKYPRTHFPDDLNAEDGRGYFSDAVWGGLGIFVTFIILGLLDLAISPSGLPFMMGSFGTFAIIAFAMPAAPVAKYYNVMVGHMLAALITLLWFWSGAPVLIARAAALGCLVFTMLLTGAVHPPGGALVVIFLDAAKFHSLGWWFLLYPGLTGSTIVYGMKQVTDWFKKKYRFQLPESEASVEPKAA